MGENAVPDVFLQDLAHKGLWRVAIALVIDWACAGQRMLSLEVFGNGLDFVRPLTKSPACPTGKTVPSILSCTWRSKHGLGYLVPISAHEQRTDDDTRLPKCNFMARYPFGSSRNMSG
jgi:hypothetical protein